MGRCFFGRHDPEPMGKDRFGRPREHCRRCGKRRVWNLRGGYWGNWHSAEWFRQLADRGARQRAWIDNWPESGR